MLVLAMQFSRGSAGPGEPSPKAHNNALATIGEGAEGAHLQNGIEDGTIPSRPNIERVNLRPMSGKLGPN